MTEATQLPPITLTVADRDELEKLVQASTKQFPQTADYLAREIDRAKVVTDNAESLSFVRMGSELEFRDNGTDKVRRITLVYPDQADVSAAKISVLTPIGAALIGLSTNQSIDWRTPAGDVRSLTVLSVSEPTPVTPLVKA